ncbi:MAG: helix-turn-helix transcriptional regulator [Anaerolineaceae bacterium]|nr:helix-turn-helix transcriptional regulator [Anaerolineaceae bacterium]MBN2677579.1 helix-turn-helix transcriptional regulator [Anaerolineaceae bacterium]
MPRRHRGWAMGAGGGGGNRHSPLTVSILEPALLIMIKERPRHGYTLLADLESLGLGTLHPSVVYRTLREMEVLGWIRSDWDTGQTQGPPRRIYQLTDQGEGVLKNWQNELDKTQDTIQQLQKRIQS